MKERPILFSAPSVRAILAGTKTQTRRIIKLPHENRLGQWEPTTFGGPEGGMTKAGETIPLQRGIWHTRTGDHLGCPFGQPGDQLWVREAWAAHWMYDDVPPIQARSDRADLRDGDNRWFAADGENGVSQLGKPSGLRGRWRPSIHMPRWASRITLEITSVRVERLQDISEFDAVAEGVDPEAVLAFRRASVGRPAGFAYRDLWVSINGPSSWEANPWVWVIDFKRVEGGHRVA